MNITDKQDAQRSDPRPLRLFTSSQDMDIDNTPYVKLVRSIERKDNWWLFKWALIVSCVIAAAVYLGMLTARL